MITGEVNVRLQADGVLHLPRSGVNIEVEQDEDGFYVNHIVPGGIPAGGGGGSITVDDALSSTSDNPVQNKVIKAALDGKANMTSVPASASVSAAGVLSFANSAGTQLFTVQLPLYAGGVS